MESMYREEILDIVSSKRNFGELKNKTHQVRHVNPVCNDEIIIDLEINNGKIIDARFHGISCFVSAASSAVLIDKIKGMKIEDIKKMTKKDIDKLLGINVVPARISCELLPLEALKKLGGIK
jgi:nitrogen fixation NifU-like protein